MLTFTRLLMTTTTTAIRGLLALLLRACIERHNDSPICNLTTFGSQHIAKSEGVLVTFHGHLPTEVKHWHVLKNVGQCLRHFPPWLKSFIILFI